MDRVKGVLYILAASFCFGMMPIWARQAYSAGLDALEVILLRTSIAALIMLAYFLVRKKSFRIERESRAYVFATCALYSIMMISFLYPAKILNQE